MQVSYSSLQGIALLLMLGYTMYDLVFDAKLGIIARTLYRAMPDLAHYSVIAMLLMLGITMASHVTLGPTLPAFATFAGFSRVPLPNGCCHELFVCLICYTIRPCVPLCADSCVIVLLVPRLLVCLHKSSKGCCHDRLHCTAVSRQSSTHTFSVWKSSCTNLSLVTHTQAHAQFVCCSGKLLLGVAGAFQKWGYTLLLQSGPPVTSGDMSGSVLNFAEQMSLIMYSIVMPITLLVFIGFVLTIIHQFLVQEWIFAYFGDHLAFMEALKQVVREQWYIYRHKGSDDSSLVATLRFIANSNASKQEPTGMELIEANMMNTEDLTLDDIREVLRLMQQEGMFEKEEQKSSTPPEAEGTFHWVL